MQFLHHIPKEFLQNVNKSSQNIFLTIDQSKIIKSEKIGEK